MFPRDAEHTENTVIQRWSLETNAETPARQPDGKHERSLSPMANRIVGYPPQD